VFYEPAEVIGPPTPVLDVFATAQEAVALDRRSFIVSYVPAQALTFGAASRDVTRVSDAPVDLRGRNFTVSYVPDWEVRRPP
jgi:hypothetical protein